MAVTITLTETAAEGIAELIDLAQRGREDFTHQAAYGDYTAEARWHTAQQTIAALADADTALSQALARWADTAAASSPGPGPWDHHTCQEAEAAAELAHQAGRDDAAAAILRIHAEGDDHGDADHTPTLNRLTA